MLFTHRGGICPHNRKNRTRRKPLAELETQPQQLVLFLDQSTEAAAVPVVEVGQVVRRGQRIAREQGDGVPVFASLPGRVSAIEERPDGGGKMRLAIVLEVEEERGTVPATEVDWDSVSGMELVEQTRQFGLVEQVGDPVPLHCKIMDGRGRLGTLIVNGTECQPYLTSTYRLGLERGRELIVGGRLLARMLGASHTIFAITGDQITSIERLERDLRRTIRDAEIGREMAVKTLPIRYPLYHDNQIVRAVMKREIPHDKTAVDLGCQVYSLAVVCALGRAFLTGMPVTHTAVTVTGLAVTRPRNLWVPLGASFHNLLENCDGVTEKPALTLSGGLLTGKRVVRLYAPVEQGIQGLICMEGRELPVQRRQQTCIQCGRCIGVCPMGLCPVFVARGVNRRSVDKLLKLYPQDCIQCGACAAVCPSQIPLLSVMRQAGELVRGKEEAE